MILTIEPLTAKNGHGIYRPLAISPDGQLIAGEGDGNYFCLWETSTGRRKVNLCPDRNWISAVAFAPDGKMVAGITTQGGAGAESGCRC